MSSSMRTLFAESIRSPAPLEEPEVNPYTISFATSAQYSNSPSAGASNEGSYKQDGWLTQHLQNQSGLDGQTSYTHGEPTTPAPRRRGNPKVLLMGLRRCGKSSIQKVVFQKSSPADTLYLEPTTGIVSATMQSFMRFESAEVPSNLPVLSPDFDHSTVFSNVGAVVWVLDSQDEYLSSISELLRVAVFLAEYYPRISFEVFIHKVDSLSEEYKLDTFREVRQRVQDELSDYGYGDRSVSYYQTSIFDHSIFEAMSKVIVKLLPQLVALETLLTKLCSTCRIQKAYLFDTIAKVYIATDASPTFLKDYQVCAEYVDTVVDLKQLYGWNEQGRDVNMDAMELPFVGESLISFEKSGDTYLYVREINEALSLICVMGKGCGAERKVLIDYNVDIVQEALIEIFKV